MPLHRIGNEAALGIVQGDGPEARLRRDAGDDDVAAAVKRAPAVIGAGKEGDAITGADRQFAAAGHHGSGVWIDTRRAVLRPRGPGPDRHATIGGAFGQHEPSRAEPDRGGDD